VGRTVPLKILRDGKTLNVNVTIAALKTDKVAATDNDPEAEGKAILNVSVAPVPAEMRDQLELKTGGVIVADVRSGPAARAGIEEGDVLLKLDGKEITGPEQFTKMVKSLPRGKPISVLVQKQQGGRSYVAITLPE
jgi:serine protease Do